MSKCNLAPKGWYCTRKPNHDGPCAAIPITSDLSDPRIPDWLVDYHYIAEMCGSAKAPSELCKTSDVVKWALGEAIKKGKSPAEEQPTIRQDRKVQGAEPVEWVDIVVIILRESMEFRPKNAVEKIIHKVFLLKNMSSEDAFYKAIDPFKDNKNGFFIYDTSIHRIPLNSDQSAEREEDVRDTAERIAGVITSLEGTKDMRPHIERELRLSKYCVTAKADSTEELERLRASLDWWKDENAQNVKINDQLRERVKALEEGITAKVEYYRGRGAESVASSIESLLQPAKEEQNP